MFNKIEKIKSFTSFLDDLNGGIKADIALVELFKKEYDEYKKYQDLLQIESGKESNKKIIS